MTKPTKPLSTDDYLKKILNASVYDVAQTSPLDTAYVLSKKTNNTILLKREDQQAVFSFKLRGAYNKMAQLSKEQLARGVICASAGNHAQGVALSGKKLGSRAVVVMPITTPQLKIDAVKSLGGEVVLFGESYNDAYQHALQLQNNEGLTFIHPFDDPDVIAGQGTIAMEILQQIQNLPSKHLDAVFVAIGGGGLISGIANYIKAVRPTVKVIGVQMNDSNAMIQSIEAKKLVELSDVGLFSDGTAVKLVGEETFRIAQELVDDYITVDTDAVCAAIKDIFVDTRSIVEPAGALAVAGIKKYIAQHEYTGRTYAAVLCGANMNFERIGFVAERSSVGEEREALFAITIPEERGSFRRLCELVGTVGGSTRSVTEFNYRMSSLSKAHVFIGLSTQERGESATIAQKLNDQGFTAIDLTHSELAKSHLRYMIGGTCNLAKNERIVRFQFPERPGALMKFLSLMNPNWNISLFHYRNQGSDYGCVLVGIQVPPEDHKEFADFLQKTGYSFTEESNNPAYHMFLQGG